MEIAYEDCYCTYIIISNCPSGACTFDPDKKAWERDEENKILK